MAYFLVILISLSFISFFALLDVRYFGLLPLFFLIFFLSQGFYEFKVNVSDTLISQKYGLYLLTFLAAIGIFGILTFAGTSNESALWILFTLSGLLRAASYIIPYPDGKELFRYGILLTGALLLAQHFLDYGTLLLNKQIGTVFTAWTISFGLLYHGVGSFFPVEKDNYYSFLLLVVLLVLWATLSLQSQFLYGFVWSLLLLGGVLALLAYALNYQLPAPTAKREISLRRVLAWEKILKKEKADPLQGFKTFFLELKDFPALHHHIFEWINVGLLVGMLASYLIPLFAGEPIHQIWYWLGIAFFSLNAFLLKKNQSFTLASRFAFSLVINFSLYISLMLMSEHTAQILPWLISRNMLCGVFLLYANHPNIKKYLKKPDLIFWLFTSLVAMLLNIVLLLRLQYSGQLIFSIIFLYLGIQGTISYYARNVIKSFASSPSTNDLNLDQLLEKELKNL